MIPRSLHDWSVDTIVDLLHLGVYEAEAFDFKQQLPDPRNQTEKDHLVKTCAAFANSSGGFLLFGITDAREDPADSRIIGVSDDIDFYRHFGAFPQRCVPSVHWEAMNPALPLRDDRVLPIVFIPPSGNAPHAVGSADQGWVFPKRTNRGNEGMPYSEVRTVMLGYYEKQLKLRLLKSELESIASQAATIARHSTPNGVGASMLSVDLSVVESILSETYTVTYRSPKFIEFMSTLRPTTRILNSRITMALTQLSITRTPSERTSVLAAANPAIVQTAEHVQVLAEGALRELDPILTDSR